MSTRFEHETRTKAALHERHRLLLQVMILADGHGPTVAGLLGVTRRAVAAMFQRGNLGRTWRNLRAKLRAEEQRAKARRWKWRQKLVDAGIDVVALPVDDPLWPACHKRARGLLVRDVAAVMREESDEPLSTDARLAELVARVERVLRDEARARGERV